MGKAILNLILNPLCAILKRNIEEALKIPGIDFFVKNILRETLEVARGKKITLMSGFEKKATSYIKSGGDHIPSMFFDIGKNKTEIDFLNGKISELGRKHKIKTPVNDFISYQK